MARSSNPLRMHFAFKIHVVFQLMCLFIVKFENELIVNGFSIRSFILKFTYVESPKVHRAREDTHNSTNNSILERASILHSAVKLPSWICQYIHQIIIHNVYNYAYYGFRYKIVDKSTRDFKLFLLILWRQICDHAEQLFETKDSI